MHTPLQASLFLQDGFSVHKIFSNLPTDPPSIFVLALLVVGVLGILWTGRGRGGPT